MTNLKEKIPTTLIEAIDILAKGLTQQEKDLIKGTESACFHHGVGTQLRNNWNLWKKDSPIIGDIQNRYGIFGHGDDVSGLILAGLWTKAKGGDVEKTLRAEAERYKAHWKRSGINPATGEEIKGFKHKNQIKLMVGKSGGSLIIEEMINERPKQCTNMLSAQRDGPKVECGVCKKLIPKNQTWCPHCGANDEDE